jgi:Tol biopolymer transport system component/DNA-binding winged helix-turn-helix (wHTH) protein
MSSSAERGADAELLVAGRRVQPALLRVLAPDGSQHQLEPKAMAVLLCLAEVPGEVVPRERLIQRVWEGGFVTDDVLTRAIGQLRKVFGDDPEQPAVIETIRKRGYRLLVPAAPAAAAPPPAVSYPPSGPAPLGSATPAPASSPASAAAAGAAARRRRRLAAGALAAAMAVLAGAAFLSRRSESPPAVTPRLLPVATGSAGEIRRPVLSPDGTRVAFAAEEQPGAGFSVEVVLLEGGSPLRLSTPPAGASDVPAAWSPDGSELAYVRNVRTKGGACEVRIVPALGGPDRRFAACGDGEAPSVAWSPDGSYLVESARTASGPRRLRLEALDGGAAARDLTLPPDGAWGDSAPAFSPDGQSIAFVRSLAPDVDDLWVVPAAGGSERRVTFDHAMVMGADWLADGRTLVFSSSRAGINSLWAVDAAGGNPRFLAGAGPKIKHPRAARSSSRVVFESWEFEINLRRAAAGAASQLPVAPGPDWSWSPRYSPDGRRAAFISTRSGAPEIWTAALPDGPAQRLTSFGGPQLASPSWSPDGERLVFVARPRGEADLFLIEARGGPPRRLTDLPGDELEPSFSRDGRWVYFAARRGGAWQIERVALAGGAIEPMTRDGGYTAQEAADGRALFFNRADRPGLFRLPLPAGPASRAELVTPDLGPAKAQAWEAGPAGVFLDEAAGDDHRVVRLGRDGTRSPVAPLPDLAWNGFSVRGDGAEVLYAHVDRRACRFVLLDRPRVD